MTDPIHLIFCIKIILQAHLIKTSIKRRANNSNKIVHTLNIYSCDLNEYQTTILFIVMSRLWPPTIMYLRHHYPCRPVKCTKEQLLRHQYFPFLYKVKKNWYIEFQLKFDQNMKKRTYYDSTHTLKSVYEFLIKGHLKL